VYVVPDALNELNRTHASTVNEVAAKYQSAEPAVVSPAAVLPLVSSAVPNFAVVESVVAAFAVESVCPANELSTYWTVPSLARSKWQSSTTQAKLGWDWTGMASRNSSA
jgi:hypothetical protein